MDDLRVFDAHHIQYGKKAYFGHLRDALRYALILIGTGLIVCVHALLPFFLVNLGSLSVKRLHNEMNLCKCER